MKSHAQRKAIERANKRARGLVPREVWAPLDKWPRIMKYVQKLAGEAK